MAGDKTEKATPKKRRDARKEGDVVRSVEINNALTLTGILIILKLFWESTGTGLMTYMKSSLLITDLGKMPSAQLFAETFISILLPFVAVSALVGVAAGYAQAGFLFLPVMPKFNRVNPAEGLKRLFSRKTVFSGIKTLLKLALIGLLGYQSVRDIVKEAPLLLGEPLENAAVSLIGLLTGIGARMAVALAAVAVADYFFERMEYEKKLMMSKQEIKDELKKTEGDPVIKSMIRSRQQRMARMRMMQAVPTADAVIVNPTHYAIAIRYEMKAGSAPRVVAKGVDRIALKIKEIAAENGVHITENRELARALYARVEVGEVIPAEFYRAVAEILAYVLRMRNQAKKPSGEA